MCCTATNFDCTDKEGKLGYYFCQNIENGCAEGKFYSRQEQDPLDNITVILIDV